MIGTKRTSVAVALVRAFLLSAGAAAHGGHEHVVMGVVQKIGGTSIDVKTQDETQDEKTKAEKIVTVALNDKTEVLRSGKAAVIADIEVGERIVVKTVMSKDKSGKDVYTAKQVQLAAQSCNLQFSVDPRGDGHGERSGVRDAGRGTVGRGQERVRRAHLLLLQSVLQGDVRSGPGEVRVELTR